MASTRRLTILRLATGSARPSWKRSSVTPCSAIIDFLCARSSSTDMVVNRVDSASTGGTEPPHWASASSTGGQKGRENATRASTGVAQPQRQEETLSLLAGLGHGTF